MWLITVVEVSKKEQVKRWLRQLWAEGFLSPFDYDLYVNCDNLEEWYEPLRECFEL